jgi:hypothetical protein
LWGLTINGDLASKQKESVERNLGRVSEEDFRRHVLGKVGDEAGGDAGLAKENGALDAHTHQRAARDNSGSEAVNSRTRGRMGDLG